MSFRPHPNLTHFPSANRPTTLRGYSCHQCRTNVTHIGPIREYHENAKFCHHVTSDKILAKFEILPICLKLVGNVDLVSSYRSGIITSGFGSIKYPFFEFLALSCHCLSIFWLSCHSRPRPNLPHFPTANHLKNL